MINKLRHVHRMIATMGSHGRTQLTVRKGFLIFAFALMLLTNGHTAFASSYAYAVCYGSVPPDLSHCTRFRATTQQTCEEFKSVFATYTKFDPGWVLDAVNSSTPAQNGDGCAMDFSEHNTVTGQVIPHDTIASAGHFYSVPSGYYVQADPLPATQCGPTLNCVGEPINPASGAVYSIESDLRTETRFDELAFGHSYNSLDQGLNDVSAGWRHSFSRFITPNQNVPPYAPYSQSNAANSSVYDDASSACTSGFPQIQSRVSNWISATASYVNNVCVLTKAGVNIGTLPILFSSADVPAPLVNVVGYDVTRDDGQLIRFTIQGGQIVAPPSINLKLQQAGSGYTLTDANDSVEAYDANGKLLTVSNRSGVMQTMSYDGVGRLSGVSDSFGHHLTLSYDSQNRLITVTRQ